MGKTAHELYKELKPGVPFSEWRVPEWFKWPNDLGAKKPERYDMGGCGPDGCEVNWEQLAKEHAERAQSTHIQRAQGILDGTDDKPDEDPRVLDVRATARIDPSRDRDEVHPPPSTDT